MACLKKDGCEGYAFKKDEDISCLLLDDTSAATHEASTGWTLYVKTRR